MYYCSCADLLLKFSPYVEKLGMDENFVDVTAMLSVPPWSEMMDKPVQGFVYGDQSSSGL